VGTSFGAMDHSKLNS